MKSETTEEERSHELTMHVFSISAAMIGVCLTAIGILRLVTAQTNVQTVGDDLLSMDAVIFVVCCFLAFWSFKTKRLKLRSQLRLIVDILFLVGLTGMACVCAIITYAII